MQIGATFRLIKPYFLTHRAPSPPLKHGALVSDSFNKQKTKADTRFLNLAYEALLDVSFNCVGLALFCGAIDEL